MRNRRSDSLARQEESLAMKTRRMDLNVKNRETVAERSRRSDPAVREVESIAKKRKRQNSSAKELENAVDRARASKPSVRNAKTENWLEVIPEQKNWDCIKKFLDATSIEKNVLLPCVVCGEVIEKVDIEIISCEELLKSEG